MAAVKRVRCENFTANEVYILTELIVGYAETVNCKKTDAVTWRKKEIAWECITKDFNARSGLYPRSTCNLKAKFDNLKRKVRKVAYDEKQYIFKTGGGPSNAVPTNISEERIRGIMSESTVNGLENDVDCNNGKHTINKCINILQIMFN